MWPRSVPFERKRGGTHLVAVRNNKNLSEAYVSNKLKQCGLNDEEIEDFLGAVTS